MKSFDSNKILFSQFMKYFYEWPAFSYSSLEQAFQNQTEISKLVIERIPKNSTFQDNFIHNFLWVDFCITNLSLVNNCTKEISLLGLSGYNSLSQYFKSKLQEIKTDIAGNSSEKKLSAIKNDQFLNIFIFVTNYFQHIEAELLYNYSDVILNRINTVDTPVLACYFLVAVPIHILFIYLWITVRVYYHLNSIHTRVRMILYILPIKFYLQIPEMKIMLEKITKKKIKLSKR